MNKIIKNIIVLGSMLGLLTLSVPVAKADALVPKFNWLPDDNKFLTGKVEGSNLDYADPVTANTGDVLDVSLFYHNGVENSTAVNTVIKATLPNDLSKQHIISGSVKADNSAEFTGNMTVNSDTNTKLAFVPGSVKWYPNRMDTQDPVGANLPNGQNGDTIVTTGINIGDIQGCWQFSGHVKFKVKLSGEAIVPKATLQIIKDVRKANTDAFIDRVIANPGNQVEYRITVRNIDGVVSAHNLNVADTLPQGVTYVGPTNLRTHNGTTSTLPDGITSEQGIIVVPELKAGESIEITFLAVTSREFKNDACAVNKVVASSTDAKNPVEDIATTCFVVPTPTPTPTTTPVAPAKNTPTPELPKTGPESGLALMAGSAGAILLGVREVLVRKNLNKKLKSRNIL